MKYHKYEVGDVVSFYGNAFHNQGENVRGVIIDCSDTEYEIESDDCFFYWRTPAELHRWVDDYMIDVVARIVKL